MKYWLIKNTCEGSFVFTKPPITLSTPLVLLCMCTSKVDSSIIEERKRSIGKKQERESWWCKRPCWPFSEIIGLLGGGQSGILLGEELWSVRHWAAAAARTNRQEGGREASTLCVVCSEGKLNDGRSILPILLSRIEKTSIIMDMPNPKRQKDLHRTRFLRFRMYHGTVDIGSRQISRYSVATEVAWYYQH